MNVQWHVGPTGTGSTLFRLCGCVRCARSFPVTCRGGVRTLAAGLDLLHDNDTARAHQ
jgi:hypothetical protein